MGIACGRTIKAFKKFHNYTSQEVANRISISVFTLAQIESGTKELTIDQTTHLAELFGIEVKSLTYFFEDIPKDENRISKKFKRTVNNLILKYLEVV